MKDIYAKIKEDHDNQRRLLDLIDKTQDDSDQRRALVARLKSEVAAHTAAEEETFYAILITDPGGRAKARHSISEHKKADDLIDALSNMDISSPDWLTRFRGLRKKLERQMNDEEDAIFARAKKLISPTESVALGKDYSRRKSADGRAA